MRSCEAGVRNFGTPFDVFGDGMRCLVLLLCGHRADDSDGEKKSKKKYAVHVLTRRIFPFALGINHRDVIIHASIVAGTSVDRA